jgi:hypothetical protein
VLLPILICAHRNGVIVSSDSETQLPDLSRRTTIWVLPAFAVVSWLMATSICGWVEFNRLVELAGSPAGALAWLSVWNLDTTLPFLTLLVLPVILHIAAARTSWKTLVSRFRSIDRSSAEPSKPTSIKGRGWVQTVGLGLLSFACSASIGFRSVEFSSHELREGSVSMRLHELPAAYHDEFSYLLQARTFLAGRLSWPPMQIHPELFHQIHVLNEPTTASRYFPWTGLWMAPFVAAEKPYFGHWIAGALACGFFHRSLLRLLSAPWALCGGLLIALSPGLAVFSNLLLAHHPTMLALSAFLWSFLKLMDRPRYLRALTSGSFLTLAMLGRPMTAAGFAFPFGVWLFAQYLTGLRKRRSSESAMQALESSDQIDLRMLSLMGLPIVSGLVFLAVMNDRITGDWKISAYQHYTDTWTPRHRFGFNNAIHGEAMAGPNVLQSYDRWAVNLTPAKAIENVQNRLLASSIWSLGMPALVLLICTALPACNPTGSDKRWFMVLMAVISLHIVHIPYWYDGILHWHYVFETAPLLLMLAAMGLQNLFVALQPFRIPRLSAAWLCLLVCSSLLPAWCDAESFWGPSRVSLAVSEQSFSRIRFEQFRRLASSAQVRHPCLILVDERQADPQLSYIVNPPDLSSEVLVCRLPEDPATLRELAAAFPDRSFYVFDPTAFTLKPQ